MIILSFFACAILASSCLSGSVLTNVAELAKSVSANTNDKRPFEISADVIYRLEHDLGVMLLLADDGRYTLAHYDPVKYDVRCRVGDRIRCSGTLQVKDDNLARPFLTNATVLGRVAVPDFPKRRISDILNGECDWAPAVVCGTVRSAIQSETSPNWAYLILNDTDGGIYLSTPKGEIPMSQFEGLVGRRIRAKGFAVPFDGSTRHYQGRIFQCSGFETLTAVDRPPSDPFDVPDVSKIKNRHPAAIAALGMHHARGTVLAVWQPASFLLQTADNRVLRIEIRDGKAPRAGEDVDVVGLPESDLFHINLTYAIWRPTGRPGTSRPPARTIRAADILRPQGLAAIDATWHGRHIRLTGTVPKTPDGVDGRRTLSLDCGSDVIEVDFGEATPFAPPVGSTVEATGTCVLDVPNWKSSVNFPQITGFRLILDSRDGLKVLSTPSWWTPARLLAVIGGLLVALLAIAVWNFALKRIVDRRSRQLFKEQIARTSSELRVDERTRLAVELHDSIAQNLTGISFEIDAADRLADTDLARMHKHLSVAANSLRSCRKELRNCLWDLRHQTLETADMETAIRQTLEPYVADVNLAVRFNVPRSRISDSSAHAILRIIRELTVNAVRHGKATSVWVAGSIEAETLKFSVRDNGCGFDPGNCPGDEQGHYGLLGIRERVNTFEGTLKIESALGKGTKVTICLNTIRETKT